MADNAAPLLERKKKPKVEEDDTTSYEGEEDRANLDPSKKWEAKEDQHDKEARRERRHA